MSREQKLKYLIIEVEKWIEAWPLLSSRRGERQLRSNKMNSEQNDEWSVEKLNSSTTARNIKYQISNIKFFIWRT